MFQDSVFNNHKKFLDGLISGTNDISSQGASQIYNSIDDDVTADSFCAEPGPIHEWIDELNTETSNEINETDIESDVVKNEWHNVDFARYLLRLSKSIVLWTGICSPFFNAAKTASTANIESYFKNVKQTLESTIPCRVDEFVCAHIDMMEGMNKDASLTYIEFIDAAGGLQNILNDVSIEYDSESELNGSFGLNLIGSDNKEPESCAGDNLRTDSALEQASSESQSGIDLTTDTMATNCIACQNGDKPSGAHKCIICAKFVHILEGCSKSCGGEEGYGEGRICLSCAPASKPASTQASSRSSAPTKVTAKQLNEKEVWDRNKSSKKSANHSYLQTVPNWNVDRRVQSKPRINMLLNGSLSTTTHKVGKSKVAVRNTCAFDAICQVNFFTKYSMKICI